MITFDKEGTRFNFRVAAVAINDNKVLLHQYEGFAFWALPGGRAEMNEHSEQTIIREMKEELGETITVDRLLWICESRFDHDGRDYHELCLYYLVDFEEQAPIYQNEEAWEVKEIDGTTLTFKWFDIAKIKNLELYPEFMRESLDDLPLQTEQIFSGF